MDTMTPASARTVLARLGNPLAPRLKIVAGGNMKVKQAGAEIRLGRDLLTAATRDDELAFFLGHELGHIALGHAQTWFYRVGLRSLKLETAADAYAIRLMRAKGYDPRAALWFLDRIIATAATTGRSPSKPRARRAAILNLIQGD